MSRWILRIVAAFTVGSAVDGVLYLLQQIGQIENRFFLLFLVFSLAYLVWGIWAGIVMLESRCVDVRHALYFWAMQIPILYSPILSVQMSTGALLSTMFNFSNGSFIATAQIGLNARFIVLNDTHPMILGANILAVLICVILYVDDWQWLVAEEQEADKS